jgi:hypothetical protein
MESREQEHRCRTAAWALAYWGRIYLLLFAYHLVRGMGDWPPSGWAFPLLTEIFSRRVRQGRDLGLCFTISLVATGLAVLTFWAVVDGAFGGGLETRGWLLSFVGSQIVLGSVASYFTFKAWIHVPRPAPPERTPAQVVRHRQLAGLVVFVGALAALALVASGVVVFQETGRPSHALKLIVLGGVLALVTGVLARLVKGGKGVATVTALLLPVLIVGLTGTAVMLVLFPVGSQRWVVAFVFLLVSAAATVITMRAILGGERIGQGEAGSISR